MRDLTAWGWEETAGIGLPYFCLGFLIQKYAWTPEVSCFPSASHPLLVCVEDINTAPPEKQKNLWQLENVRLKSWDEYTKLSFIQIYRNLTTLLSFRSEQAANSPGFLKGDKVIFFRQKTTSISPFENPDPSAVNARIPSSWKVSI